MSDHELETSAAVETLVDAMMDSCGQLAVILDHMSRHENKSAGAEPIPDVLRRILTGILLALPERHGPDDLATAAQMLTSATALIGEELYLVDERPAPPL
jgi:hypothetical protein